MLNLLRRWRLKDVDEKNHGPFNQMPYMSHICVKCVGALLFQENGWQSLLHGKMSLNLRVKRWQMSNMVHCSAVGVYFNISPKLYLSLALKSIVFHRIRP